MQLFAKRRLTPGTRNRIYILEHLEKRELMEGSGLNSTVIDFRTTQGHTYEIQAVRMPIPSTGTFVDNVYGHVVFEAIDKQTRLSVGQAHGFAIDPNSNVNERKIISTPVGAVGWFGDKLELINAFVNTAGWQSVKVGELNANQLENLEVKLRGFQKFTQDQYLPYSAFPAKFSPSSMGDVSVDEVMATYNSGSIGRGVLDIYDGSYGISSESKTALQKVFGAGLGSPGIDDDILRDFSLNLGQQTSKLSNADNDRFAKIEQLGGIDSGNGSRYLLKDGTYVASWIRKDGVPVQVRAKYGFELKILSMLESKIITGADLIVQKATQFSDSIGNAASEITIGVWDGLNTLKSDDIVKQLGSHVSQAFVSGNPLLKSVVGTLGGEIATNLFVAGKTLTKSALGDSMDESVLNALNKYTDSITVEGIKGIVSDKIKDGLSSIIVGQLTERLGIGGADGAAFGSYADTVVKGIAGRVIDSVQNAKTLNLDQIFVGVNRLDVSSAVGRFFGNRLSTIGVDSRTASESIAGAIGSSVLSAHFSTGIGSWLGGTVLAKGATSAATSVLGTAIGSAVSNVLGNIILPGLGALVSTFAGDKIGALLGKGLDLLTNGWFSRKLGGSPGWHYRYMTYDTNANRFSAPASLDFSKKTTGAIRNGTNVLMDSTLDTLNTIANDLGIAVDTNSLSLPGFAWLNSKKPSGANDYQVRRTNDRGIINAGGDFPRLVRIAVEDALRDLKYSGGDPLKVRAFDRWKQRDQQGPGESLNALMSDIAIANDYATYLKDPTTINALIEAEPNSVWSIGWVDSLIRAQAMGLNKVAIPMFKVVVPTNAIAGTKIPIDFTASTNGSDNFTGTIRLVVDNIEVGSYVLKPNDGGRYQFSPTITVAGTHAIEIKLGSSLVASSQVEILASSMKSISLKITDHKTAGVPISVTITALDEFGNTVKGYVGRIQLSTNDTTAYLPQTIDLSTKDQGTKTFTATFETQGDQTTSRRIKHGRRHRWVSADRRIDLTATDSSGLIASIVVQDGW